MKPFLTFFSTALLLAQLCPAKQQRVEIKVGQDCGDFQGKDGRVIQAAVNYVKGLGGGTVHIGAGTYLMRDSLELGDDITIKGEKGKTVLASCDAHQSGLASSAGTNQYQVSVSDPSGFRIGDGIMVQDEKSMYGFSCSQTTIVSRIDHNTFGISRPLSRDYEPKRKAKVTSAFPVVSARGAKRITIEGLTIDGNSENMHYLTGCRGGGIYLLECENVRIQDCEIRNYNGDGISFQTTQNVVIQDCASHSNAGCGLHPGCGTEHATVKNVKCHNNGGDGLFLCWNVKYSNFSGNDFSGNQRHGISIGMKDSDNQFLHNVINQNSKAGIFFREQPEPNGAHRNLFKANIVLDNSVPVEIQGAHNDLRFEGNAIGFSKSQEGKTSGAFVVDPKTHGLVKEGNELKNVK